MAAAYSAHAGFVFGLLLGAQLTICMFFYHGKTSKPTERLRYVSGQYVPRMHWEQEHNNYTRQRFSNGISVSPLEDADKVNVSLAVMILSSPDLVERRDAIRETWLRDASLHNVTARFLIGTANLNATLQEALETENKKHKDLAILPDFAESFEKLSMKVLQGIVWTYEHINFDFLMKVDDDVYVRLDQAKAGLDNIKAEYRDRVYWGYFAAGKPQHWGKYTDLKWPRKCSNYFPYAYGAAYIVARRAISLVARLADTLYADYLCEDTNMGSWLAPYDLVRIHDIRYTFSISTDVPACNARYVASHLHRPRTMHEHYNMLQKSSEARCNNNSLRDQRWVFDWNNIGHCCVQHRDIQKRPFSGYFSAFQRNERHLSPFIEVY